MRTSCLLSVFIFFGFLNASSYSNFSEPYATTLFDDFDSSAINTSRWQIATWSEHGGQTGKDRCFAKDGFLNMVFINSSESGFLSAAIQTREEYLYGRWEARLKPSSVSGVLNSMYTIDWNNTSDNSSTGNGTKQEIDIEFLTFSFGNDTGSVHYAVHAQDRESFQTNPDIPLSFNPSDDFHVWGFEVTPEKINWFVDSIPLKTYEYDENDVSINAPYQLKFNVWSAQKWINGPPAPNVETVYLIDWIRFTPYTSNVFSQIERHISLNPVMIISDIDRISIVYKHENAAIHSSECRLYSLDGSLLNHVHYAYSSGESSFNFSTESFSSGCYLYQIRSGVHKFTGTFLYSR